MIYNIKNSFLSAHLMDKLENILDPHDKSNTHSLPSSNKSISEKMYLFESNESLSDEKRTRSIKCENKDISCGENSKKIKIQNEKDHIFEVCSKNLKKLFFFN